ncbi:PEP-CTERM sorting domain-containing protein [Aquabacterium sp.]|uniref:PEP-CTERM sorting domain-containing protein n=1 Tax=Aquabacterium sp. TaxID=1872578 RepID=UPI003D6C954E
MPFKKLFARVATAALAVCAALSASLAHAELQGRDLDASVNGYEAFYDTVLNITWLADANFAKTSGHSANGQMTWEDASTWAANVTVHGLSGWRLPNALPIHGLGYDYRGAYDGSSDLGYGIRSPRSEMSYMFYENLGLLSYYDEQGQEQAGFGRPQGVDALAVSQVPGGFIRNLGPEHGEYWAAQAFEPEPGAHWVFDFEDDGQFALGPNDGGRWGGSYAWLVRSGDVSAVPEPSIFCLFGLGGLGLALKKKSRKG